MKIPENLLFSEDHEWILVNGDEATIGISDYAQEEMGDVVFVELPEVGEEYAQFDNFAVIESVKAVSDVYLPAGGEVLEVNEELLDKPELINEDPYKDAWIAKIKLADKSELDKLMDSKAYEKFLEEVE
jgi:glycine cleavage system H protein